ncbi:MAG: carbohydrate ABC transporter permease, partial [Clostridia bacterium]
MKMSKKGTSLVYVLLICGVFTIILPLYITIMTAFKTVGENTASFFALPQQLYWGNFEAVLSDGKYLYAFGNTVYVTAFVLLGNML